MLYKDIEIRGFDRLCRLHGYKKYADVSSEMIEKYKGILPDFLLAVWEKHGLSSHGEGYIWTVNPDDYSDIIRSFFGKDNQLVVFARNSFGKLYAAKDGQEYRIRPQIGIARYFAEADIDNDFKYTLITLGDSEHKEHLKAMKKLGPIDQDHMYGYVPMLALGGDGSLKETKIVKTQEYLMLVAEVVTEANRNGWDPLGLESETAE
jgi:hypothetical protein